MALLLRIGLTLKNDPSEGPERVDGGARLLLHPFVSDKARESVSLVWVSP